MKARPRRNDFATYLRLIGYLRGYGLVATVLFSCIVLEALFTVTTISTLKPILHLVENKPLVEVVQQDAPGGPGSETAIAGPMNIKARAVNFATPYLQRLQDYSNQGTQNKIRVLGVFVAILVGSGIMTALMGYGVGYLSKYLAFGVVKRMREHLFEHMMGLDLSYFTAQPPGVLMSHVTQDVKAVEGAVDLLFSNVIKTPITVITLVSFMLLISPSLTFFTFIIVPALAGLLFVLGRRIRRVSGRVQKSMGLLSSMHGTTCQPNAKSVFSLPSCINLNGCL